MAIAIDRETMTKVLNNSDFITEACNTINEVIDKEFEKEDNEIDFDLIDECSQTIIALRLGENNPVSVVFPLASSQKFLSRVGEIGWKSLSKSVRIVIIAAAVFAATISASAAVGNITGNNIFENLVLTTETTVDDSETSAQTTEKEKASESSEEANDNKRSGNLADESVFVRKAEGVDKGRIACYETQGADEFNPKYHHKMISYDTDNTIEFDSVIKEKASNKNTEFDEEKYIGRIKK